MKYITEIQIYIDGYHVYTSWGTPVPLVGNFFEVRNRYAVVKAIIWGEQQNGLEPCYQGQPAFITPIRVMCESVSEVT